MPISVNTPCSSTLDVEIVVSSLSIVNAKVKGDSSSTISVKLVSSPEVKRTDSSTRSQPRLIESISGIEKDSKASD